MTGAAKAYHGQIAVKDMTLVIESGQAFALLGPNGAGKTTSIAMMLGLIRPSKGQVRLFGQDPQIATSHEAIGVMLQSVSVPDRLTVSECLNLFRGYYTHPLPLSHLLGIAGLESEARKMAGKLSGGKTRRLQFSLAMAGDPQAVFLD
jgi:ABC-2 type transport system ATP-binding protein